MSVYLPPYTQLLQIPTAREALTEDWVCRVVSHLTKVFAQGMQGDWNYITTHSSHCTYTVRSLSSAEV